MCEKFISETASWSELSEVYKCVLSTKYTDSITFYEKERELLDFLDREKSSPIFIVLVGDWGMGKTFLSRVIEEEAKKKGYNVRNVKIDQIIVEEGGKFSVSDREVVIIDEVENLENLQYQYRGEIVNFFTHMKKTTEMKDINSVVFLLATPSGYTKIFSYGGLLYSLLPETYTAFKDRIRERVLTEPTKVEYFLMLYCMLKSVKSEALGLVEYLNFLYYLVPITRRNITKIVNNFLCQLPDNSPEAIYKVLVTRKEAIADLYRTVEISDARLFKEEPKEIGRVLRGYDYSCSNAKLVKFSHWRENFAYKLDPNLRREIEDIITVMKVKEGIPPDDGLYVIVPKEPREYYPLFPDEDVLREAYKALKGEGICAVKWEEVEKYLNVQLRDFLLEGDKYEDMQRVIDEYKEEAEKLLSHDKYSSVYPKVAEGIKNFVVEVVELAEKEGRLADVLCNPSKENKKSSEILLECRHRDGFYTFGYKIKVTDDLSLQSRADFTVTYSTSDAEGVVIKLTHPLQRYFLQLSYLSQGLRVRKPAFKLVFANEIAKLESLIDDINELNKIYENIYHTFSSMEQIEYRFQSIMNYIIYYKGYTGKTGKVPVKEVFETVRDLADQFRTYDRKNIKFTVQDIETSWRLLEFLSDLDKKKLVKLEGEYIDLDEWLGEYTVKVLEKVLKRMDKEDVGKLALEVMTGTSKGLEKKVRAALNAEEVPLDNRVVEGVSDLLRVGIRSGYIKVDTIKEVDRKLNEVREKVQDIKLITIKERDVKVVDVKELLRTAVKVRERAENSVTSQALLFDMLDSLSALAQIKPSQKSEVMKAIEQGLTTVRDLKDKVAKLVKDVTAIQHTEDELLKIRKGVQDEKLISDCILVIKGDRKNTERLYKALNKVKLFTYTEFVDEAFNNVEVTSTLKEAGEECKKLADDLETLKEITGRLEKIKSQVSSLVNTPYIKELDNIKRELNGIKSTLQEVYNRAKREGFINGSS
ncbi:P-loop NTPase fold protein [Stygiolobus caldivivus]|uniref:P-loop NTPase fold protein n=1 Tax=Stygiolobus caldivivus TaxID=2824673 RepID=UPI001C850A03|nr:P-loop NTPase fold protein [Stygiolobus caldivivus]